MDLKNLASEFAKIGLPLLGAALPIPGGAAIGAALAAAIGEKSTNPQDILTTLTTNAEALEKAKEFESMHQETMLKLMLEAEQKANDAVTDRWKADMGSDSWLAKNIRPMVLVYLLSLYAIFAAASGAGYNINKEYVALLGQWGMLVMSAYFVGRTVEKVKGAA